MQQLGENEHRSTLAQNGLNTYQDIYSDLFATFLMIKISKYRGPVATGLPHEWAVETRCVGVQLTSDPVRDGLAQSDGV